MKKRDGINDFKGVTLSCTVWSCSPLSYSNGMRGKRCTTLHIIRCVLIEKKGKLFPHFSNEDFES